MKPTLLFRIAAVLIVLFAAGHTLGFRAGDPSWGAQSIIEAMKSFHFPVQGFTRSYWDFYVGFGFFTTVFLLLSAFLAWQLGDFSRQQPAFTRRIGWALTLCFAATAVLSWQYFFVPPIAFSILIFGCLLAGTLLTRPAEAP